MNLGESSPRLMRAGLILFCLSLAVSLPLNNVAIGLIALASLAEGQFRERFTRLNRLVVLAPVLFYAWHGVGLVYTANQAVGWGHLETKGALLILPLAMGTSQLLTTALVRSVLRAFVLSMTGLAAAGLMLALYRYAVSGNVNLLFYYELTSWMDLHPVYFALYLAVSVLAILHYREGPRPLFGPRLEMWLIGFLVISIFMLTALVVMAMLPFIMAIYYYHYGPRHHSPRRRLITILSGFLLLSFLAVSLPYTRSKLKGLAQTEYSLDAPDYAWGSLTIRLAKWECSWAVVREHYLFGVGTGDAQDALMESYRRKGFAEGLRNNYNTHSQYLETWTMLGLPGLLLLAVVVWPRSRILFVQTSLLLISASLVTENLLDRQKGVVFVGFILGLIAAMAAKEEMPNVSQPHP